MFDYLFEGIKIDRKYTVRPSVVFAGNLSNEKSGYIYKLKYIREIQFELFGSGCAGEESSNVHYRGTCPPEQLVSMLCGKLGLVWDRVRLETCGGKCDLYLRYNNSHKFSLYIAAGLPIIVWNQSALADFVKENGIGICLDSLKKLSTIIGKILEAYYLKMKSCVESIR